MNSVIRFKRALAFEPVDRPPVWIMRQAGRTLPEYLEVRKKYSFWEICKSAELAALVTLQPLKRFPMDAAIIFSDILTVPAVMGMDVKFSGGLSLSPPIRNIRDIHALKTPDVTKELGYVADVIRCVRKEVGHEKAVLGFSGAPYTLANYMVEGGSSKHFYKIKSLMYTDPEAFSTLLSRLSDVVVEYLAMQMDASATAVQLFDSWAGELTPEDFRRFVLPHVQSIISRLKSKNVPVIYYVNGIGNLVPELKEIGADVIGVDWRINLSEVRRQLGEKTIVQGNLDPTLLFGPEELIRERVFEMFRQTGGLGHIANLGHGVIPETPISGIAAFVKAVTEWTHE